MKTVIFFDVDHTIYNSVTGEIPGQTKTLLRLLSEKDDVILGLATGRGLRKLEIVAEVLPYFKIKVLVNGAYVMVENKVIFDSPIENKDIIQVLKLTKGRNVNIGMVGIYDEAVNYWDERVSYGLKSLRGIFPQINEKFYLEQSVYQLWMFADSEKEILKIAKKMPKFKVFPWHRGGADFNYLHIDKAEGIRKSLVGLSDYQLVCIGDGANDVDMISMADIGIAMGNSRFAQLKEKADYIAPHIDEDQLYDFFKKLKLI